MNSSEYSVFPLTAADSVYSRLQPAHDVDGKAGGGIRVLGDVKFLEHFVIGVGVVAQRADHEGRHIVAGGDMHDSGHRQKKED